MSFMAARQFAWRTTEIQSTVTKQARVAERGRGGGIFDLADRTDRNDWNSDDEDVDDFGRRKKKRAKKSEDEVESKGKTNGLPAESSLLLGNPLMTKLGYETGAQSDLADGNMWSPWGLQPSHDSMMPGWGAGYAQMPPQGYDTSIQSAPLDGSMWSTWGSGQPHYPSAHSVDGNMWSAWGAGQQGTSTALAQPAFAAWGEKGQGSQATPSFPSDPSGWGGKGTQSQPPSSTPASSFGWGGKGAPTQPLSSTPASSSGWGGKGAQSQPPSSASASSSGWGGKGVQSQPPSSTASSSAVSGQAQQAGPVIYSQQGTPTKGNLTLEQLHARLPCKFFAEGHCKNGQNCQYKHVTTEEARSVSGLKARRYCNYFGQGKCLRGIMCPYIHGTEEMNSKPNIEKLASEAGATFVDFETGLPKVVAEAPKAEAPKAGSHPQFAMTPEELDKKNLTITKSGTIRLKTPSEMRNTSVAPAK